MPFCTTVICMQPYTYSIQLQHNNFQFKMHCGLFSLSFVYFPLFITNKSSFYSVKHKCGIKISMLIAQCVCVCTIFVIDVWQSVVGFEKNLNVILDFLSFFSSLLTLSNGWAKCHFISLNILHQKMLMTSFTNVHVCECLWISNTSSPSISIKDGVSMSPLKQINMVTQSLWAFGFVPM